MSLEDRVQALETSGAASDLAAVGRIEICGYNDPLPGTVLCNGGAYSRTTYSRLYSKIGITWGAGDGSTTFNVPNYVDRAPWYSGSLSVGQIGNGVVPNVTGFVKYIGASLVGNGCSGAFSNAYFSKGTQSGVGGGLDNSHLIDTTFDASRSSSVYSNVDRVIPAYATCLYCIRY